jgi:hypothetical protein
MASVWKSLHLIANAAIAQVNTQRILVARYSVSIPAGTIAIRPVPNPVNRGVNSRSGFRRGNARRGHNRQQRESDTSDVSHSSSPPDFPKWIDITQNAII